ncbi:hypothetical protein CVT24_005074 [Panaeolus cyanescens]|uniref:Uncharacterized protein n=1 Tax=Panaeolus cyanescens TaxID=181874 RepID=A0A409VPL4_9AGAR|nr:hypothetical protein CVT24_005074 [Panaeolus cyanescens]
MIAMGLVPELVLLWALKQRLLASSLRIINRDKKWTQTHAFFMIMGGYYYYDENGNRQSLSYDTLQKKEIDLEWPTSEVVTQREIEDRSKASLFTKVIVVVQTLWFCIQFIARLILHLTVTELETTTFAYAVLNIIVYLLWMNKPFDVRSQILVRGPHDPRYPPVPRDAEKNITSSPPSKSEKTPSQYLKEKWNKNIWQKLPGLSNLSFGDLVFTPWDIFNSTFMTPFSETYTDFSGSAPETIDLNENIRKHKEDNWGARIQIAFLRMFIIRGKFSTAPFGIGIAIIFGGIHLIAWPFHFPSVAEMWLWRASSLALVAPAVFLTLLRIPYGDLLCAKLPKSLTDALSILSLPIMFLVPLIYAVGRVLILFLPLVALRRLPCGAFEEIDWAGTKFPHF